jgi:HAD superfamily phosphatase (TIGR01668 family)
MGLFEPDRYFSSLTRIDVDWDLARLGLTHVFLDVDNTIRRRDNDEVPRAVRVWLAKAREKGISLCLLSNNFHDDIYDLACQLDLPVVAKAMKPLPFGFRRAMKMLGATSVSSVMVGDQLFTDIVGAHVVGMKAFLVRPLVDVDLKHTMVMRRIERSLLREKIPQADPLSDPGICAVSEEMSAPDVRQD